MQPNTFDAATADLEHLMKSRARYAATVRRMSDEKDYMESDSDDFDRKPQGRRRRDMRDSWRGIQSEDYELSDAEYERIADAEVEHEMLVSGRPSRIRFPGARGDSEIHAIDEDGYLVRDMEDPDDELEGRGRLRRRNAELRSTLGGGAQEWRTSASQRGIDDGYFEGKSFSAGRIARRGLRPIDLRPGIAGLRVVQVLDPGCGECWRSRSRYFART
jgi:hypothetical protein